MGGRSSEHEISLLSGNQVVKNLNSKKYDVVPVVISKDSQRWVLKRKDQLLLSGKNRPKSKTNTLSETLAFKSIEKQNDLVFIAMHGEYGEDGKIQAALELVGIPYTGSGVLASALAMNKEKAKIVLKAAGLNVPRGLVVTNDIIADHALNKLKFPVFVKPNNQGSSVGSSIARSKEQLIKSLKRAFKVDKEVLVEEYLEGTELTVAILGNKKPTALPPVEIVSKNEFFDYESKYDPKFSNEICPARITKSLTKKVQAAGLLAYRAIGCRDFARVDMIVKNGKIFILEVNTIPGLTPVSLFPKAAKAAGFSYPELLDEIIDYALNDRQN